MFSLKFLAHSYNMNGLSQWFSKFLVFGMLSSKATPQTERWRPLHSGCSGRRALGAPPPSPARRRPQKSQAWGQPPLVDGTVQSLPSTEHSKKP